MRTIIPVIHHFDDRYATPAAVSMLTMLEQADPTFDYDLRVVHSGVSPEHQAMLQELVDRFPNATLKFVLPESVTEVAETFRATRTKAHFSLDMYWTLLMPDLFPDIDIGIITDVDVLWKGDIARLWHVATASDDGSWQLAGVRDVRPVAHTWLADLMAKYRDEFDDVECGHIEEGVGAGLLVANLSRMREVGTTAAFLDALQQNLHRLRLPEQDVINLVAHSVTRRLPLEFLVCTHVYEIYGSSGTVVDDERYSSSEIQHALENPVQLHFAGKHRMKPWLNPRAPFADEWIEALARTNFLQEWLADETNPRFWEKKRLLASFPVPFRSLRRIDVIWRALE